MQVESLVLYFYVTYIFFMAAIIGFISRGYADNMWFNKKD
jgi:hypothetical protein